MRRTPAIVGCITALSLMSAPAFALPGHAPGDSGSQSAGANQQAYGKQCSDQSKKHVKGEHGTPFSRCVTAMAKLKSDKTDSPRTACKTMSKKHVKGEHGTPFSRCVRAGAKLLHEQDDQQADDQQL